MKSNMSGKLKFTKSSSQVGYEIRLEKSILDKIKSILCNISVEPVIFCTMLSSMIYSLTTQNLYMEKACRVSLEMNITTCDALSRRDQHGYTRLEEAFVQKLATKMIAIKSIIQGLLPLIITVFVGSWSDRHNRRKPVILAPVIGELLCCIFLIINVYFFYQLPIILTALADSVPMAVLGGWPCLFLGAYSFVAAKSSQENRTIRIGRLSITHIVSMILGVAASGIIFMTYGFFLTYVLCSLVLCTAIMYGYFFIHEVPLKEKAQKNSMPAKQNGCFLDFFDITYFLNTFKVCFKDGPNNRRRKMIIVMITAFFLCGIHNGESGIAYLYARLKFGWNSLEYSGFHFFKTLSKIIGSSVSLYLFTKCFHCKDATLGMISQSTSLVASLIYGFATTSTVFYTGNIFDALYITSHIALRSIAAKIVPQNELGQMNSIYGIAEAVAVLTFTSGYSFLYQRTITIFPGTFYILSAGFKVLTTLLFGYLYWETIRADKLAKDTKENTNHSDDSAPKEAAV